MKKRKRLLFFIPVFFGVLVLVFFVKTKKSPVRDDIQERSRPVHVVRATPLTVVPQVTGYGYVQPTETWEAISEVSGKIVQIHPELAKGAFFAKGEVLMQIDPESYGLAESRGKATVLSVEAQLKELSQQKKNFERLLKLERQRLSLAKKELQRKRALRKKGFVSQSELEQEEKNLIGQKATVKNLLNNLALIPSQEKALLAKKESDESSLSEIQLDLENTVIKAPFDCRISAVHIELNQFAPMGSRLVQAINISEVEIEVKIVPGEFVKLLAPELDTKKFFSNPINMESLRDIIDISAQVRLPNFHDEALWEATFKRTSESVDIKTGALTVYVSIKNPYEKMVVGVRPPLVSNLFCQVTFFGQERKDSFVIPLRAVHGDSVYLVSNENRLEKRRVVFGMILQDFALVKNGLQQGESIVLTDLVPAIEGMLLEPIPDTESEAEIKRFANTR